MAVLVNLLLVAVIVAAAVARVLMLFLMVVRMILAYRQAIGWQIVLVQAIGEAHHDLMVFCWRSAWCRRGFEWRLIKHLASC